MNKILLSVLLVLVILSFLYKIPTAFASTIYSNDFTSSTAGFTPFFGTCSPSSTGLTCNNIGSGLLYNSELATITCVSADITNAQSKYSYIALVDDTTTWLNNPVYFDQDAGGNIVLYTNTKSPVIAEPALSGTHNYMLCKNGSTFTGFVDGVSMASLIEANHNPVSFALSYGSNAMTNLIVTDSLPTPPTPTPIQLNVPLIKQTSDPWQSQIYDSAKKWAPSSPTINSWGCALTDAAMVFQYNGILKMPNGAQLNPGTLNAWLESQSDGYVGNGLVNWLALQRLSRLVKLAFNNPGFAYDALEWKWLSTNTNSQLLTDLQNNIPDILAQPGHFVVDTGTQGTTYTINDSYYSKTLLSDYGNTFNYGGHFVPSHTDLSYLMIVGDSSTNFSATDSHGNPIGQQISEGPIQNPNDLSQSNGPSLHIFYIQQPQDGTYTLTISGNNNQNVTITNYQYDEHGNVIVASTSKHLDANGQNTSTIALQKISFSTLIADLEAEHSLGHISKGSYEALLAAATNAQKEHNQKHPLLAKVALNTFSLLLKILPGISSDAKTLLQGDAATLLATL